MEVPTFDELLGSAKTSAVHLEMRDAYMTSSPWFKAWQAGDMKAFEEMKQRAWLDLIKATVGRGVTVRRVRIVSEPVSEYIRFEHATTDSNIGAGEEIRWLPRRRASTLLLPGNDFWLVDDHTVLWNHFAGDGEVAPEGKEISADPAVAKMCGAAFAAAWDRAIPHQEYRLR